MTTSSRKITTSSYKTFHIVPGKTDIVPKKTHIVPGKKHIVPKKIRIAAEHLNSAYAAWEAQSSLSRSVNISWASIFVVRHQGTAEGTAAPKVAVGARVRRRQRAGHALPERPARVGG